MKDKESRMMIKELQDTVDRLLRDRRTVNFDIRDQWHMNPRITVERDHTIFYSWVYLDSRLVFSCGPKEEQIADAFMDGLNLGLKKTCRKGKR